MGFGNIGIGELMVIFLIVMMVFGPNRLPEIARNMGKFMRDFRRETNAALKELKDGIEPIKVGIFDEPDAGVAAKSENGETTAPLPGVAAAGGAGVATAAVPVQRPGNGTRKPAAPARKKTAAARKTARAKATKTATGKTRASTARPKAGTAAASKKRPSAKSKSSSARSGASRKR